TACRGCALRSQPSHRISGLPDREGALLTKDPSPGGRRGPGSGNPGPDARASRDALAVLSPSGSLGTPRGLADPRRKPRNREGAHQGEPLAEGNEADLAGTGGNDAAESPEGG